MSTERSKPYFFSFDSKSKPGYLIAHCVRIETIEMPMAEGVFDTTQFTLFPADYDEDVRLRQLVQTAFAFVRNNNIQPE